MKAHEHPLRTPWGWAEERDGIPVEWMSHRPRGLGTLGTPEEWLDHPAPRFDLRAVCTFLAAAAVIGAAVVCATFSM